MELYQDAWKEYYLRFQSIKKQSPNSQIDISSFDQNKFPNQPFESEDLSFDPKFETDDEDSEMDVQVCFFKKFQQFI